MTQTETARCPWGLQNCLPEENEITVTVLTFNFVHRLDTTMTMSV